MDLKLALFDESVTRPSPNCSLLDNADRIRASLREFDKETTQTRKFVVLKNDKNLYVVFGPQLVQKTDDPGFYKHSDLRAVALHFLDKQNEQRYAISGGGAATFAHQSDNWTAEFGGSSMDYGIWDPAVLEERHKVVEWLDMPVMFVWRAPVSPRRKR